MKVVIIGCGLGGLACAIQCRREGLQVLILEKMCELSEVGAGIQLPPNATKVMRDLNLLDKLYASGLTERNGYDILRWQDGSIIATRPDPEWNKSMFGNSSHVMHRADYQRVLVEEARRLGVEIRLNSHVIALQPLPPATATLSSGEIFPADVIVGGDGLHSAARTAVLGHVKSPEESGDLAYRVVLPREVLEDEKDEFVRGVVDGNESAIWWGPEMHVVLYPIRNGEMVNLVLCCPDNLPTNISRQSGSLAEMKEIFQDWDPRIRLLLDKVSSAVKWKIWKMEELDIWVRGCIALLGDSCHPSVPYAASGAAMAVEDGVVLARLLGLFSRSSSSPPNPTSSISDLLQLYQDIRKERATKVVNLANSNRDLYQMGDGPEQEKRDELFREHSWRDESEEEFPWKYGDLEFCKELYGFDALGSADEGFARSTFSRPKAGN